MCAGESKTIQCGAGEVIEVKKGFYGRSGLETCPVSVDEDRQNVVCSSPQSHAAVGTRCNGLQSCIIDDNLATSITDPCFGTEKYFSVYYICGMYFLEPYCGWAIRWTLDGWGWEGGGGLNLL